MNEQKTALAPIRVGERGLQVQTLEDMWRWAQYVVKSGLAPDSFKTPEQVVVATQYGRELGFSLMQGLRSIAVVNGRPQIWGDAALALVKQSGLSKEYKETLTGEGDKMVAKTHSVRVYPNGIEDTVDSEFSVEDAKTAGLWGKRGTWTTHPKRMLKYKSRAFNLRDNFPDVLCGLHLVEEMEGEEYEALPAPSCDTPKRANRKPVENTYTEPEPEVAQPENVDPPASQEPTQAPEEQAEAEPADEETLKVMYAGVYNSFTDLLSGLNAKLTLNKMNKLFLQFATFTLSMSSPDDLPPTDKWTVDMLTALNDALANGLPEAIREMVPVAKEAKDATEPPQS